MPAIRTPHLSWRQRLAVAGGLLVFAAVGGSELATKADALPLMHHVAQMGLTPGVCSDSGQTWQTTLTLTGTFLELHPVATISNYQAPLVTPLPFTKTFIIEPAIPSVTFSAHVVWDDGFTVDLGPFTATKPDDCPPPTTTTCPDCTPGTQVIVPPDTTTLPEVATTVAAPTTTAPLPSTTALEVPPSSVPASGAPGVPSTPATLPPSLPVTGGGDYVPVVVVVGAFLVLVGLIGTTRSRS